MLPLVLFVLVCLTHGIVGDKPSLFAGPGPQGGYSAPLPVLQSGYNAPAPAPLPVPQGGYSAPSHGGFSVGVDDSGEAFISGGGGGGFGGGGGGFGGGGFGGGHFGGGGRSCGPNEVLHVDGSCVVPHVTRNVFVYAAPKIPVSYAPRPALPKPRIDYNVVFVRTPEHPGGLEPIVIPPPQQKTLVYVLTKNGQIGQQVIEVPAGPLDRPEVYYINYNDGDNPSLPGGLTLQDGLAAAVPHNGKLIGGGGGGFGGGFGGGHGGGLKGGFGGGLKGGFGGDSFEGGLGGGYAAPPIPVAPSRSY